MVEMTFHFLQCIIIITNELKTRSKRNKVFEEAPTNTQNQWSYLCKSTPHFECVGSMHVSYTCRKHVSYTFSSCSTMCRKLIFSGICRNVCYTFPLFPECVLKYRDIWYTFEVLFGK